MTESRSFESRSSLAVLRKFVKSRAAVERCELCSAALSSQHEHLVEPASHSLICSCQACAILFSGKSSAKYRRVPRQVRRLDDFVLTDAQWDSLRIPISLAFFFYSTPAEKVMCFYPSPAGATESLLDLESWQELVVANPILETMEPDTEALLVNRIKDAGHYYLAPIDECYKLVGVIRSNWHGLSGGSEMWSAVEKFFSELNAKSS